MSAATVRVYVALLDEGTDCWRPTMAEDLGDDRYRLLPTDDYDRVDERWQFDPGTIVICERRELSDGPCLVATRMST